jgi:HAD superfamily hydrolase (TIGR01484 family)
LFNPTEQTFKPFGMATAGMKPLHALPAAGVHTVFTDIDDTLSSHGRLHAEAYAALQALQRAGLRVVPVTGRPAGWCDHIARMWPVEAVIGENGAFYMWHDAAAGKLRTRHLIDDGARAVHSQRLAAVRDRILREVPGCALASDQFSRLYDLAIDFCEDVPPLPPEGVDRIVALMEAEGMTAKVSSIHVNGWFGSYDKLAMARRFMAERHGLDLDDPAVCARCVFVGDSPNDAPMFAFFPLSVGVANVSRFAGRLTQWPNYVTEAECGAGFAELAQQLLAPCHVSS